ncbi:hypothetical protein ASE61_04865 [Bosea sp. Root670]|uniref:hypothetical protein n=1 Tax=Bosea sp. Root670 TaxID=1736583 RepID=UPI000713D00B|nr:hypothetical protein [Bosea sp. Root670]KRE08882.1 hypothetical protein ASE61_04865 [Bosea sp. Root670]
MTEREFDEQPALTDALAVEVTAIADGVGNLLAQTSQIHTALSRIEAGAISNGSEHVERELKQIRSILADVISHSATPQRRRTLTNRNLVVGSIFAVLLSLIGFFGGTTYAAVNEYGFGLRGQERNMAVYLWLNHNVRLKDCMQRAFQSRTSVSCPLTIDYSK